MGYIERVLDCELHHFTNVCPAGFTECCMECSRKKHCPSACHWCFGRRDKNSCAYLVGVLKEVDEA